MLILTPSTLIIWPEHRLYYGRRFMLNHLLIGQLLVAPGAPYPIAHQPRVRIARSGIRPHPGFLNTTLMCLAVVVTTSCIPGLGLESSHIVNSSGKGLVANDYADTLRAD